MKTLVALLTLLVVPPSQAVTINVLINNGLEPATDPNNSIADGSWAGAQVYVRDEGCGTPDFPSSLCFLNGAPTTVETLPGATVGRIVVLAVRSMLDLAGGTIEEVEIFGGSRARIRGATVTGFLDLYGTSIGTFESGVSSNVVRVLGDASLRALGGELAMVSMQNSSALVVDGTAELGTVLCMGLETSRMAILGGEIGTAVLQDACDATMRAGHVDVLGAHSQRVTRISGGTVDFLLSAGSDSRVVIDGGDIGAVVAENATSISLRDGVRGPVSALENAVVKVSGGRQPSTNEGYDVRGTSEITFYGSGFAVGIFPQVPGEVTQLAGALSGTLVDGTQFVSVAFARDPTATIRLAAPPPVFTSKVAQRCAVSKLEAFAKAATAGAQCASALRKGAAKLARKQAKVTDMGAAVNKLLNKFDACEAKQLSRLDRSWSKAQRKAEKKEPGVCTLDEVGYTDARGVFVEGLGRLVRAAAPRYELDMNESMCLASDAAAISAVGRYLADALGVKGRGFRKGLDRAAVAAADARLVKSETRLRRALDKLTKRDAKSDWACARPSAEDLMSLAGQIAAATADDGLGVFVP